MELRCAVTLAICFIAFVEATPALDERSLRITSRSDMETTSESPAPTSSVSFVPLFSLLANIFPRLFNRFSGVNQPGSRELGSAFRYLEENDYNYIKMNDTFCNSLHMGKWPDPGNCRRFYICAKNSNAPPYCSTSSTTPKDELVTPSGIEQIVLTEEDLIAEKHLQVKRLSTPCIILSLYQCPDTFLYRQRDKQCVRQSLIPSSELCRLS